ncbi:MULTISPECIES: Rho termination factor N-terminal domain-containing protein [unclassified Archaeoglobus]|uniref:Rho termination factor N-terminal domain-containing protein n=1 Tax=unclassified Archaeoglobus TaxID=2643606 RepID=UPI0025B9B3F7|nr:MULTISPECIES: Rho termination factor N-terminal domain-containing protein [unclassified Archaeoglobus]
MSIKKKVAILKKLTKNELVEICKNYGIKGYSGLSQAKLAEHIAKNCNLSLEELENLANSFIEQRLVAKVNDARDHFLLKKVQIEHFSDDMVIADVAGYRVKISNLGKEDFSYSCDEKCADYVYQVRKGRYPFCKHYPAVLAELVYQGLVDSSKLNNITGRVLEALLNLVEERKKEEGLLKPVGRDIENSLRQVVEDYVEISRQNSKVAREKYHSPPEKVFEILTEQAFQLLEFDTIVRTKESGWDLLVIGTHATPPYIAVIECKTATSGVYDYITRNPDYLIKLKTYCIDLVKEKLLGVYKDYVRYMVVVGPDFPVDIERFTMQFRHMTGGIKLSFLPAQTLVYLVKKYRENPILTHDLLAMLFESEKIIRKEDVDRLFEEADRRIESLIEIARQRLRERFREFAARTADACFVKMDEILLQTLIYDVLNALQPDLVKMGKKSTTGVTTIHLKHDYFKIWEKVLNGLVEEFVRLLEEESNVQQKRTELKEDLIKFLELR